MGQKAVRSVDSLETNQNKNDIQLKHIEWPSVKKRDEMNVVEGTRFCL